MARQVTTRDRLRYRFDATLSRGTIGVIAWLGAITVVVVLIGAFWLMFALVAERRAHAD